MEGGWEGRQGEREVGDGRAGGRAREEAGREGVTRGWRVEGEGGWEGGRDMKWNPGEAG